MIRTTQPDPKGPNAPEIPEGGTSLVEIADYGF